MIMYNFYGTIQKGLKHQKNDDCFLINGYFSQDSIYDLKSNENEFIVGVADGVGSSSDGSYASRYLFEQLAKHNTQLTHAVILNIINKVHSYLSKRFTGNALTVFSIIYISNEKITIYHLGDTRAYKLTPNKNLIQLTNDHTYIQKLIDDGIISENIRYSHPQKHIILQSLGSNRDIHIDIYKNSFEKGEQILLTTDGIHDYIKEKEIKNILISSSNLKKNIANLFAEAKENGSKDDLTAILVKYI